MRLAAIVEGDGEVAALPVLLRGWFSSLNLLKPFRVKRDAFLNQRDYRQRYLELARRLGATRLLVLLDSNDVCPKEYAPGLLAQLAQEAPDLSSSLVLACREFEAWLLAGADCLDLAAPPVDVEAVRGAKEEIRRQLGYYAPTVDQPRLAGQLVQRCQPELLRQRSPSFDKFWRELMRLTSH